ncbi:hypothetical protein AGLY_012844 [Aphis glycines]|uniref:Uncharacterized protein n=1 Tax=Aphis glycines TaxID=307491 RepID=A0A6G0T7T3_APHGL|nr:hypothetical protein AGLY_012844 [Aphis glycines]
MVDKSKDKLFLSKNSNSNSSSHKSNRTDTKRTKRSVEEKKKSSSLCKEPKLLNGNRSDDESNAGGSSKQKSTIHKNKSSSSDKTKSSSSNHKSSRKDNTSTDVVDNSKDKSLSKNSTSTDVDKSKHKSSSSKNSNKSKDKSSSKNSSSSDIYKPKDKSLLKSSSSTDIDKSKDKSLLKNSNNTTIVDKSKDRSSSKNSNRTVDKTKDKSSSKNSHSTEVDKSKDKSLSKNSNSANVEKSKNKNYSSHKSNRNDSKRLKLSQPETNKLPINNERIEESKLEKQEEPEWNDFRSSTITNDEQDAANVLLSMSTISYESSHSEIITENILFIENSLPISETLKTPKIKNELKKENIDHTKIVPSSNNNDIKENSELKPINSEKSILLKNSLKGVPTIPSHLFEKECSVNLERYTCKNINIQSCPSNNVEITNEHQKSDEIVMDEKELKTLNVEVNLDPNENDKTNECNSNAILKVPKLKIKLLPNQIDSINKCKRKKHHKDKESKKLKLSKSLNIPSKDSVSKNIMFEKLDQKFNNNTEVKMNDSASTLSKQTSYKEIENNSVEVLDDDKSHCSFKGFSEAETIPCKNYKILKSVIKALQAKIHEHDVINDGFKGFTNVETHPCKHRDIVYAELIKLKDSICSTDSDFIGFSEEETQMSNGHKYVIQQLELAKKEFGSFRIQNKKLFNEVVTAYLYESHNDSDAISRAIYSKSINDDKKDCTTENNNNNKHDNWVVEQEIKYKLLPAKVTLERLGRIEYGCSSSKHVSDSSQVPI